MAEVGESKSDADTSASPEQPWFWGFLSAFWLRFLALWLLLFWAQTGLPFWDAPTNWFATHILGINHPLAPGPDTEFSWVLDLLCLVIAMLAALLWSILRWKSIPGQRGRAWLTLAMRLALATTLFDFGFLKLLPVQMAEPIPSQLLTRLGDFTPMEVLWASMGSARWYETATGVVELVAATLLVLPRAWALGAGLAVIAMSQVVLLDLFYDVPAKLFATHFLAVAVILFAPHAARVWRVLVGNRQVDPLPPAPLAHGRALNVAAHTAVALVMVLVAFVSAARAVAVYSQLGGSGPKPPLYGAWKAQNQPSVWALFIVDGYDFDKTPTPDPQKAEVAVVLELADGSVLRCSGEINVAARSVALTASDGSSHLALLDYADPEPGRLRLVGDFRGQRVDLVLDRVDLGRLPLNNHRGIHWVQEAPA